MRHEYKKYAQFSIPKNVTPFDSGQIAYPICQTAIYVCRLARREKLSLKELYLLQKIGFDVRLSYEKN